MTKLSEALDKLYERTSKGRKLGLERVEAACEALGHPEKAFEAVHVAGTNGKGSVCAFVSSMAKAAGKKVGMYTSPHLMRYAERIQIDGEPIDDESLADVLDRVLDAGPELTFFEASTVAAFLAFKEANVELAVIEVGLGGRLDATNVIPAPRVAVITRVSFDHMAELGDSLEAIAAEKVAIIKKGSAVVTGKLHPAGRQAVSDRLVETGGRLVPLVSPEPVPGARIAYPRLAMFGSNLAVANTVARELGFSTDAMTAGIEATTWPGRNELLHRNGQDLTLLDCAHNPDAMVALSHVLEPSLLGDIESRKDIALVFGALKRKSWKAMLARLENASGHRVYVPCPGADPVPVEDMVKAYPGDTAADIGEALAMARTKVGGRGVVVVTGSSYLVGAARALLLGVSADAPVDM